MKVERSGPDMTVGSKPILWIKRGAKAPSTVEKTTTKHRDIAMAMPWNMVISGGEYGGTGYQTHEKSYDHLLEKDAPHILALDLSCGKTTDHKG